MKKLLSILIAIALMLSLSITAFAEENETATITVHMTDYGYDGWESENSYNYVVALSEPYTGDDFEPDDAIVLAECTFADGNEEIATFTIDKMQKVYFYWVEGPYAEECGFTIYRDGTEVYSHVSEAEESVWACGLEDGKLFFISEFVDNRGTTVTYNVDPTYTVTIPATVALGETATIKAENVVVPKGKQVEVALTEANDFKVATTEGAELTYTVKNGETEVAEGETVLAVNPKDGKTGETTLSFVAPTEIQYAGSYTGTVTFTVAVKPVPKTIINFTTHDNWSQMTSSYQAEEGMTWGEWVTSSYNTGGYTVQHYDDLGDIIRYGYSVIAILVEDGYVYPSPEDVILADQEYILPNF